MIYLASPYTHPDPFVREERYLAACRVVARYLEQKRWVYSPIVHCHELAKILALPRDAGFWKEYNHYMLSISPELHVLMIDGWSSSVGLADEISVWSSFHPGSKWQKAEQ